MKNKTRKSNHGTQEWAVKTVNCCTGCSHDCLYCYAKEMAIRFKQATADQWHLERIRPADVTKRHKKYDGQVMFPSSHDITPNNIDAYLEVLKNLLDVGNKVLVVSKPHLECIKRICDEFEQFKDQILFRFSIGACDDHLLSYWEPNAPRYNERKKCLRYAYKSGFQTSVSVEPMLDSANIDILINELSPYVTHSIWIGKMNHMRRFEKGSDIFLKQAANRIRQGQIVIIIKQIYKRYKKDPLNRWKKEIKKVIGIPVPKLNGLDI